MTLGAIALQGLRQADARLGETVAVIGLGLLGQLTVQLLTASGCRVVGADLDATKLELARTVGAEAAVLPDALPDAVMRLTEGHGVDAVVITAGTKSNGPVELAGTVARKKGRVVIVGAVGLTIPREPYYKKELELRMSMSYGPGRYDPQYEEAGRDYPYAYVRWTEQRNMQAFLALVKEGKVTVAPLVTHRFSIEEAATAYEALADSAGSTLGILLRYPGMEHNRVTRIVAPPSGRRPRPVDGVRLGVIGAGHHVRDRLLPA
ncbi:MAG: zinc-binding alcohol dehydrogenase, partial [Nitrospira sp.]